MKKITLINTFFILAAAGVCLFRCTPGNTGDNTGSAKSDATTGSQETMTAKIRVVPKESDQKVDIFVGDELFTSYIFPKDLEKPVLYPIVARGDLKVTRGFPRDPRPGERVDHPHHVGYWFNYGDVNGLDFWNNSYNIPAEKKDRYGSIVHKGVKNTSGGETGELEVTMDWIKPDGAKLLQEDTKFIFSVAGNKRIIDRITTLTAMEEEVLFEDNKEGVLGIRMTRALELPSDKPEIFTDASGIASEVPVLNNDGVTGDYLNSEGITGGDVWGKRAVWCKLYGEIEGNPVSVAIVDHPQNPGYPTHWHARGYGLFAANPLGQKVFSDGKLELNLKLLPNESVTFRYRVIVQSESELTAEELNESAAAFAAGT